VGIHGDRSPSGKCSRRYNAPTTFDVSLLMVENHFESSRIILEKEDGRLRKVVQTHG